MTSFGPLEPGDRVVITVTYEHDGAPDTELLRVRALVEEPPPNAPGPASTLVQKAQVLWRTGMTDDMAEVHAILVLMGFAAQVAAIEASAAAHKTLEPEPPPPLAFSPRRPGNA